MSVKVTMEFTTEQGARNALELLVTEHEVVGFHIDEKNSNGSGRKPQRSFHMERGAWIGAMQLAADRPGTPTEIRTMYDEKAARQAVNRLKKRVPAMLHPEWDWKFEWRNNKVWAICPPD